MNQDCSGWREELKGQLQKKMQMKHMQLQRWELLSLALCALPG